jgi:hypothetical protein
MLKQADALKVCPIPDACLLVMAQRTAQLLGLPEPRSLICLVKNLPDQVEGYLEYLQPDPTHSTFCSMIIIWRNREAGYFYSLMAWLRSRRLLFFH